MIRGMSSEKPALVLLRRIETAWSLYEMMGESTMKTGASTAVASVMKPIACGCREGCSWAASAFGRLGRVEARGVERCRVWAALRASHGRGVMGWRGRFGSRARRGLVFAGLDLHGFGGKKCEATRPAGPDGPVGVWAGSDARVAVWRTRVLWLMWAAAN